jgi:hypothetical protein
MAKTITQLPDATSVADSDELIVQQGGITKRASKLEVLAGIKNASIASDAAIAHTKLANITAGRVLLGNASNVPTATELTGDVTVSNTGVTAVGSAKVTPTMLTQPLTLATAQNTTSGTSIDFTGIPSWVKRITVMFDGVSTNGASLVQIQIGDSGGIETTGYSGGLSFITGANACGIVSATSGCILGGADAVHTRVGCVFISKVSGNKYVFTGMTYNTNENSAINTTSIKTLSDVLDRVRITTVNGTDTFDAGSVNIMYEG